MNFKKTAVALAAGMMLSGGAMAQTTTVIVPTVNTNALSTRVTENASGSVTGVEIIGLGTTFADIADAVSNTANLSVLAASLNERNLDGSIVIDGATVSFSAIENVAATANATSSNVENATATARAINGNSLATTVIGAMGTTDLENRISDKVTTDFAAQATGVLAAGLGAAVTAPTDLTGGLTSVVEETLNAGVVTDIDTTAGNVISGLGELAMVSASVNAGELAGNIAITATNGTPTWFLNEQVVASVNLTNLDAATTVIGAMNTTTAINEVMRDINLKTAVQVTNTVVTP